MERSARPATVQDLKRLIDSLNREGVEYVLIGGFALIALGYVRGTVDIDLLLPPTTETADRVKRALLFLPDRAANQIDPEWFTTGDTIRVADEIVVDLMFRACGETYASLQPHIVTVDFEGVAIRTLDLEGLLKTKLTYREKDRLDRAVLEEGLAKAKRESP